MRVQIVTCDICGRELGKNKPWYESVQPLLLATKKFPNIQYDLLIDDCCGYCADKIKRNMAAFIDTIRSKQE